MLTVRFNLLVQAEAVIEDVDAPNNVPSWIEFETVSVLYTNLTLDQFIAAVNFLNIDDYSANNFIVEAEDFTAHPLEV